MESVARGEPRVPVASRRASTAPWSSWLRRRSRCKRAPICARSAPRSWTSARTGVVGGRSGSACTGASASKRSSGPPRCARTKPSARNRPPCRCACVCASIGRSTVCRTPAPSTSTSRSSSGRDLGPFTTRFPSSRPCSPRSGGSAKAGRRERSNSFTTAAASTRTGVSWADKRSDPWSPTRSSGSTMVTPSRKWMRVSCARRSSLPGQATVKLARRSPSRSSSMRASPASSTRPCATAESMRRFAHGHRSVASIRGDCKAI